MMVGHGKAKEKETENCAGIFFSIPNNGKKPKGTERKFLISKNCMMMSETVVLCRTWLCVCAPS